MREVLKFTPNSERCIQKEVVEDFKLQVSDREINDLVWQWKEKRDEYKSLLKRNHLYIIAVVLFFLVLLGSYVFEEIHKAEESGISAVVSDVTDTIIYFGFLFIFLRFREPIKEIINKIIKKFK